MKGLSALSQLSNLKRMKFSREHAYKLSGRKNNMNEKHAARSQFKFKTATSTDRFIQKPLSSKSLRQSLVRKSVLYTLL